jgi:hypothetical protein
MDLTEPPHDMLIGQRDYANALRLRRRGRATVAF